MNATIPQEQLTATEAIGEMLSMLRLLAIQGLVPDGREQIERWELALSAGEPGPGRLALIRVLIEESGYSPYEVGETKRLVERIETITTGTPVQTARESDGSAYLGVGDLGVVLDALDEAGDELRYRAGNCNDCDVIPSGLCTTCEGRMDRADEYDRLFASLGGDR